MSNTKPALVLVHGLWHTPKTLSKLTNALESAGHEVHVPSLPSMNGTRPPNSDLTSDISCISSYVENLVNAGRQVVAIMHSYGGVVGTSALHDLSLEKRSQNSLPGGVVRLVYVCAFALPEGRSMVDKVREFGHEDLLPLAFDFAEDDSCVSRDPKTLLIGPGCEEDEVEQYVQSMVRGNGKTMYQGATQCAWRDIPVTYVHTTQDMTVPLDYQKSMVEHMREQGREVHTVELETGHCPNLTKTTELVDTISKTVAALQ